MLLKIGTYSLEVLRDGYSWNENCGENGKHATSSVSLSVRPVDGLVTYLMSAESNLNATLMTDGGKVLFTGVVRPYTSHYYEGSFQGNISLEIMDYTETLHKYVWEDSTKGTPYQQTWKGKTLSETVVALFALVGRTCSTFSTTETLYYFKLESGQYLDDIISELLYEYGLDYKWTADGTAEVFSTFVDGQNVGSISDVRNQLNVVRSDDTTEGLKVSWKEYQYETGVELLNFDSGNQTFNEGWEGDVNYNVTLSGKLYTGIMHDNYFNKNSTMPSGNLWSWNIDTDSTLFVETDISQVSAWIDNEDGISWTVTLESYDINGCRMWLAYNGRFNVIFGKGWTWHVKVTGNRGVAVDSEATYAISGANPETIELKYRLGLKGSAVISSSLVKQLYLRTKYSKVTYSFSSLTSYNLGGFYTLEGNTVRIISKTQNEEGIYSYKCEGCKPYSEVDIPVIDEARSVTKVDYTGQSAYDAARENGYTGTKEEWLNSLKGTSSAGLYLYKRADSLPESFDGGAITYTFATGVMTGSFGTWSTSIPSGDSTLYFVYCRVTSKDETYTVTTGEWSVPAIMSETGAKGADGKTVSIITIYQRAASKPAVPSETVTYNFGSFTATGLGAWSLSMVEGTDPLWATSATAISSDGASDSIEPSEWITPVVIVENGKGGLTISTSADSWVFPADEDGIVKSSEYEKFSVEVLAVRGGKSVEFTMSAELTGITNVTVSGNTVSASSSSVMLGDSASVKLSIVAEGETYVKTISLAKAKQSKPTELWFAWSKSESVFTPRDSNFWIMGGSFIYYNSSLMGNIPFTSNWLSNWAEIEAAKTEEYCYLWCKTSESGTPFLFTGESGKTGAYEKKQYCLSDSKTEAPTEGWTENMPNIVNSLQYLWIRYKLVPTGGNEDEIEWSDPVVSNVGIAVTESKIGLSADGTQLAIGEDAILLDAPKVLVPKSLTANEVDGENFFGKEFIVKEGGSIRSQNYSTYDGTSEGKGFRLDGTSGSGEMNDITLGGNAVVRGTIQNNVLRTVKTASGGKTYTSPSWSGGKYWSVSDAWDRIKSYAGNIVTLLIEDELKSYTGTLTQYSDGFAVKSENDSGIGLYFSDYMIWSGTITLSDGTVILDFATITVYARWTGAGIINSVGGKTTSSGNTFKGINANDKTVQIEANKITVEDIGDITAYDGWYTESTWPSYSLTLLSENLGVYGSDFLPMESDVSSLGSGTAQRFKELWVKNLHASDLIDLIYPIGSVYMSTTNTSPASFLGGSWEKILRNHSFWTLDQDSYSAGYKIDDTSHYESGSLPNITGYFGTGNSDGLYLNVANGAFYAYSTENNSPTRAASGSYSYYRTVGFSANNSNSLYSINNSDIVRPTSFKVFAWYRTA